MTTTQQVLSDEQIAAIFADWLDAACLSYQEGSDTIEPAPQTHLHKNDVVQLMRVVESATLKAASGQEPYTTIDMGFGKWEVGAGTNAGVPCIAFGVHGSGKVGELITIEPRQMSVEETHAVITFANYEGFAVLQEKMNEVRALHFSTAPPTLPPAQPAPVDEREAFERYMTDNGAWPQAVIRYDSEPRGYRLLQTANAWTVWQARAALQGAQAPQATKGQP